MNKYLISAFVICVSPLFVIGQNVSGFWKGTLGMNRGCFAENNIELQISMKGDTAFGSSYHYLDVNYYVKKKLTGSFDRASKKIVVQEGPVTTFKIPQQCQVCIKSFALTYSRSGNQEFLKGEWSSVVTGNYIDCGTGPITLSRVTESAFREIPEIIVDTGEIRLDFYDNGEIDDDSISVRINDKTVLTSPKARRKTYYNFY
jgi:hypothetical protein